MQGNNEVIFNLNKVLGCHLIAINQYFLHARMYQDWGLIKIGNNVYHQSIAQMKHADHLIKRILFLEGLPNVQDLGRLKIGENTEEMLKSDLAQELRNAANLRNTIEICEQNQDFVSRKLLREILKKEEDYIDWLETELSLISDLGLPNYLQSQIEAKE